MSVCHRRLVTALVAAVWLASIQAFAQAQPALSHVSPGAVAPGKTTELVLHGSKFTSPVRLWTSFPAQIEAVEPNTKESDGSRAAFKLTLPAGCPLGIAGIAAATTDGLTDVTYLLIDDLESVADSGTNHAPSDAQNIALPIAIDGLCDGTLSDYYRFTAKAGQRISCEVVAARLGWDLDPLIRVLNAGGRELLLADDDPSAGPDPRFVFTAPTDGDYTLELRDNRYKPGGRYRLRLGDFPLVTTPSPLIVQRGIPTIVSFLGERLEGVVPSLSTVLGEPALPLGIGIKPPGPTSSGWSLLGVTDLPVCTADESGTQNPEASLGLPCVACGLLEQPGDRDVFEFTAKTGLALRFRSIARSLGSAAVLSLRVHDSAGKQLAESAVTETDEPVLAFTPSADGTYRLTVEDLAGRGGLAFAYAIDCRIGPQFSLLLKNDKNNKVRHSLPSGGALYLDVQCQRAGYDGPIALSIESEQSGWQAFNHVIPAKSNEVRMYIQPPIDLAAGEIASFRVVGRPAAAGASHTASMTTTVLLRVGRPQTPYPPAWHDGLVSVSNLGAKAGFYTATNRESLVPFDRQSGNAQLIIDFERTDAKFKDAPLTVVPIGLPAGVTVAVKRNGNGPKETYEITLTGPKDLPLGEHTFRYFTYAEMGGVGRGKQSGDIRLSVTAEETKTAAGESKTP